MPNDAYAPNSIENIFLKSKKLHEILDNSDTLDFSVNQYVNTMKDKQPDSAEYGLYSSFVNLMGVQANGEIGEYHHCDSELSAVGEFQKLDECTQKYEIKNGKLQHKHSNAQLTDNERNDLKQAFEGVDKGMRDISACAKQVHDERGVVQKIKDFINEYITYNPVFASKNKMRKKMKNFQKSAQRISSTSHHATHANREQSRGGDQSRSR